MYNGSFASWVSNSSVRGVLESPNRRRHQLSFAQPFTARPLISNVFCALPRPLSLILLFFFSRLFRAPATGERGLEEANAGVSQLEDAAFQTGAYVRHSEGLLSGGGCLIQFKLAWVSTRIKLGQGLLGRETGKPRVATGTDEHVWAICAETNGGKFG